MKQAMNIDLENAMPGFYRYSDPLRDEFVSEIFVKDEGSHLGTSEMLLTCIISQTQLFKGTLAICSSPLALALCFDFHQYPSSLFSISFVLSTPLTIYWGYLMAGSEL